MLTVAKARQFTTETALSALGEMHSYYIKGDKDNNIPSGTLLFFNPGPDVDAEKYTFDILIIIINALHLSRDLKINGVDGIYYYSLFERYIKFFIANHMEYFIPTIVDLLKNTFKKLQQNIIDYYHSFIKQQKHIRLEENIIKDTTICSFILRSVSTKMDLYEPTFIYLNSPYCIGQFPAYEYQLLTFDYGLQFRIILTNLILYRACYIEYKKIKRKNSIVEEPIESELHKEFKTMKLKKSSKSYYSFEFKN